MVAISDWLSHIFLSLLVRSTRSRRALYPLVTSRTKEFLRLHQVAIPCTWGLLTRSLFPQTIIFTANKYPSFITLSVC